MAYAALISLAQTTNQILNHHEQYSTSPQQKRQIRSLHEKTIFLQAFLEDVLEKAHSLEGHIRDAATEADNILQIFQWEQTDLKSHDKQLRQLTSESRKLSHQRFRNSLDKVTKEIDLIEKEVMSFKINSTASIKDKEVQLSNDSLTASSSSSSIVVASTHKKEAMVGFDDDLLAIKERLCGEPSSLQIIPIVGMGGIGKTTLARHAYNDPLTKHHFDIRVWVTISQDYSIQQILSSLQDSVKEFLPKSTGRSNEVENVYKSLKGRRYLIVMDDVWSNEAWDDLRRIFPDDGNGSRIMLTTRLSDLASYTAESSYKMRFMDSDRSWDLLRQKVFVPPELEDIGKMIATNCGGLPLAIVVIAGLLSTVSKNPSSWREIANKVNSAVATKDGHCENILSLSYSHLPHHLRPCFLYMGGFPEDYEIHVSRLIRLWVAEGFLKPPEGSRSLEDAAEEYLEDLVRRSLVLVTKRKPNGKMKTCGIHDVLRELCITKALEDKFLVHVTDLSVGKVLPEGIKDQRRISITRSDLRFIQDVDRSTIRTVICSWCHGKPQVQISDNCRLLNVLDLVDFDVKEFIGRQVSRLYHLRYLNFRPDSDYIRAESISMLQNLQTLVIRGKKLRLVLKIWRMPKLRHLVCSYIFDLVLADPKGAAVALENLQTLSVVKNFVCSETVLNLVPNLRKFGVYYKDKNGDFLLENLVHLHQLENFKLEIASYFRGGQIYNPVFPRTLKKLTLIRCHFSWNRMWVVSGLPNLEVLKLIYAYRGEKWETTEGGFPRLKYLLIDGTNLEQWIAESSHFPSLKWLVIRHCQSLREIPEGIGEIPTLELIMVKSRSKSLLDSAKRIKEEQESYGNALQVRCIVG